MGSIADMLAALFAAKPAMPPARTFDENYDTVLAAPDEARYLAWKQRFAPNDSGADYDLRGAFLSGLEPSAQNGHWADTFKKPNHPTFSNESMYAPFGRPGRWEGERYIPPRIPAPPSGGVRG